MKLNTLVSKAFGFLRNAEKSGTLSSNVPVVVSINNEAVKVTDMKLISSNGILFVEIITEEDDDGSGNSED